MRQGAVARAVGAVPDRDRRGGIHTGASAAAGDRWRVRMSHQRIWGGSPVGRFVPLHASRVECPAWRSRSDCVSSEPLKAGEAGDCRQRQAPTARAWAARGPQRAAAGRLPTQVSDRGWPTQQVHHAAWPVRRSARRNAARDAGCAPSPCSSKVRARPPQATRGSARTAGAVARGYSGRRSIWAALEVMARLALCGGSVSRNETVAPRRDRVPENM